MSIFPVNDTSGICWKFMEGKCTFGLKCKYSHPDNSYFPPFQITSPFVLSQSTPLQESTLMHPLPGNRQWAVSHIPYIVPRREDQHSGYHRHDQYYDAPSLVSTMSNHPGSILQPPAHTPHMPPLYAFYKPLSWKTAPCKHFVKTKGWCPMGDSCNYIHDLTLQSVHAEEQQSLSASSIPLSSQNTSELFYPDGNQDRVIGSRARDGPSTSHCWAHVQGFCRTRGCRYFHPQDVQPYKKYTPCLAWSTCPNIEFCAFKHPEPLHTISLTCPHTSYISTNTDAGLTYLPQVVNGTTYFPIPAPTPQVFTTLPFHYGDMSTSHTSIFTTDPHNISYLDPFSCQSASGEELKPVAALPGPDSDAEQGSHIREALSKTEEFDHNTSTEDHEFPYRPPQNQRVGHARRFSVTLKSRELGDESFGSIETGNSRRMTHASRDKRKSWAAFSRADNFQTNVFQR